MFDAFNGISLAAVCLIALICAFVYMRHLENKKDE